jgi:hypothetical protein
MKTSLISKVDMDMDRKDSIEHPWTSKLLTVTPEMADAFKK